MAATMKHRRSKSKRNSTRGANRYDVVLTKAKKLKKFGGSFLAKAGNVFVPPHMVTPENPEYNGIKVISKKDKE